ncbi:hypothetical protein HMN09_01389800 [Mycena chlorophos]|uniref:Uncharacterized protein n=1 Tax=Mycena chlorophos TaxID=658473 RepID=A0A8H6RZF1_MYCCL|nr:hypothetical protein HMN09_01389800 [Mycena chlorophos]
MDRATEHQTQGRRPPGIEATSTRQRTSTTLVSCPSSKLDIDSTAADQHRQPTNPPSVRACFVVFDARLTSNRLQTSELAGTSPENEEADASNTSQDKTESLVDPVQDQLAVVPEPEQTLELASEDENESVPEQEPLPTAEDAPQKVSTAGAPQSKPSSTQGLFGRSPTNKKALKPVYKQLFGDDDDDDDDTLSKPSRRPPYLDLSKLPPRAMNRPRLCETPNPLLLLLLLLSQK